MQRFIYSNILKAYTWATEVKTIDLPVNPISFILITLSGFNAGDEATWAEIIAFLNKVTITHEGNSVFNMESEDIAANMVVNGLGSPLLTANLATDNLCRELTLIIPFGRTLWNPNECFPATQRGEFQLKLDCTVPAASLDNGVIDVEVCQLPEATPEYFLKSTLLNVAAPGATGDNDVPLPIGNMISKFLVYSTTYPAAASHVWGVNEVRVLMNNSEFGYVSARAKALHGLLGAYGLGKTHDIAAYGTEIPGHYICLDYDFWGNNQYLLETAGASSLIMRLNMGVDEACKIITNEIVSTATLKQ
jgi:hypothetical protein